ncbi:alpha/beta hydrolase [Fischerella thermalis]|uniref:alpha/beta hydrolase n=1 Tax=Fischerella thermalis TaxID=372787 RepID=UPI001A05823B|nr:alpha/beta hydrolase [Fischerella thermalis]MBF1988926.1 alpha/beta hydrolase [Fischerella thermalis M58_A2018_009]MBF2062422.1 alpha/beta hydrolase [Fischerella thermalis M66_A2018_004]MBF2072016.1 alpha/beta hydrolase [Fischerella thermalis M48_A2018_028]
MQFQLSRQRRYVSWRQSLLCSLTLALSWGAAMPATLGAETVTIRLGPFQQSVAIADLEKFAKTGDLPDNLQLFSSILTPQIRELLTKRLEIDPAVADKFVAQLKQNPVGKQFISSLTAVIPGSSAESLQATLNLALRQVNGLSALGFLRAYPQENVTVDASQAISVALELNPGYWQSQIFGAVLSRELSVKNSTPITTNFDPAAPGKQTVQQQTFILQDRQRNRTIPVDIYWSNGDRQNPMVVISHGFGANRRFLRYLARHLASYGITVAAIEHPGSNVTAISRNSNQPNLQKLLPETEFIDRPKDISFTLNELAKLDNQPGQLQGKLNTDKVTVIGHSLGGYTALALLGAEVDLPQLRQFCKDSLSFGQAPGDWLQCAAASLPERKLRLKDERVKSAIALNPLVGNLFGKNGLAPVKQPVLILTGTEDTLTPALKHQITPFSQLGGEKYLLSAVGGTHLSISDPTYQASDATTIVRERRGEETKALRQLLQGVSLAFVKQQTPEAKTYQPFLTPAYAQSLSSSQLPLSLVSELPANLKPWLKLVGQ